MSSKVKGLLMAGLFLAAVAAPMAALAGKGPGTCTGTGAGGGSYGKMNYRSGGQGATQNYGTQDRKRDGSCQTTPTRPQDGSGQMRQGRGNAGNGQGIRGSGR